VANDGTSRVGEVSVDEQDAFCAGDRFREMTQNRVTGVRFLADRDELDFNHEAASHGAPSVGGPADTTCETLQRGAGSMWFTSALPRDPRGDHSSPRAGGMRISCRASLRRRM
jgi:hypothetical protein